LTPRSLKATTSNEEARAYTGATARGRAGDIKGGRHGVGIIDFQGNQGATRHLQADRSAVARIGSMTHIPIILIDLFTEEGVVGRSYLKPYLPKAMKYLIPALLDFGEMLKGRRVSPVELYETARKSLHFVGYQGLQ
jgi:hypothetical protein